MSWIQEPLLKSPNPTLPQVSQHLFEPKNAFSGQVTSPQDRQPLLTLCDLSWSHANSPRATQPLLYPQNLVWSYTTSPHITQPLLISNNLTSSKATQSVLTAVTLHSSHANKPPHNVAQPLRRWHNLSLSDSNIALASPQPKSRFTNSSESISRSVSEKRKLWSKLGLIVKLKDQCKCQMFASLAYTFI